MSSSVGKSARLGRPASLDTLPAELLKAVVVFVARQDERLAGTKHLQPPRTRWPFEKGLIALSLTCKRLRAATLPFLCKKVVVAQQLLRPVFQFGRIPQAMLDGIEELDCRGVTLETFAAAGKGLSALPNLTSVEIDYGKLPPFRAFAPATALEDPAAFLTEFFAIPADFAAFLANITAFLANLTMLFASIAMLLAYVAPVLASVVASSTLPAEIPVAPANAFRQNRQRIRSLTLTDVDPGEFANWLNVFARRDILQHLTIGPSPNLIQLDQLRMFSCLSSYSIISLDLSDISLREQGRLDMDDVVSLLSLQELQINVRAPKWLRLVERLAPNVVKLSLVCTEMPLDAHRAALRFPRLRELRLTGPASSLTLLAVFIGCEIATLVWIQQRASYWETLGGTDFVEHLGDFTSLRVVSFGELSHLPPGELDSVKTACARHGIKFGFENLDHKPRMPSSRMSTLDGLSSPSEIATSLDGLVEWMSDRIDWLRRRGDVKGLREIVDLMSGVDARETLERA
ncbi:hypothetical protein JCM10296v2_004681 [Rhodotorula toruloides]